MMKKLLRDPLFHFLLLGALLFQVYQWRNADNTENVIRVSSDEVDLLVQQYQKTWMKVPTQQELQTMIDNYVLEEIYAREAFKLDMYRDDPVVKRRMRMKMELLNDLLMSPPTEQEVESYYQQNLDRYSQGERFSFEQIYFNGNRSKNELQEIFDQLLEKQLVNGDPSMLRPEYLDIPMRNVQREFGGEFLTWLKTLDDGRWQGPFRSPLGWHLVRRLNMDVAPPAPLEQIYDLVKEDLRVHQKQAFNARQQQELLKQYRIEIN